MTTINKSLARQIQLNTGTISATNTSGTIKYVDSTGKSVSVDAVSDMLNQNPAVYAGQIGTNAYNHALGIFGDSNIPVEMTQTLAAIAAYYSNQTGVGVYELFKNGTFEASFLAAINSLRDAGSQIAQFEINTTPTWANNRLLAGAVSAAISGGS